MFLRCKADANSLQSRCKFDAKSIDERLHIGVTMDFLSCNILILAFQSNSHVCYFRCQL